MTKFTLSLELFAAGNLDKTTALINRLAGLHTQRLEAERQGSHDELTGRPTVTTIYVSMTVEPCPANEGVSASMFVFLS